MSVTFAAVVWGVLWGNKNMLVGSNIPLTEPEIIQCVFLSGADFTIENDVVRFIGWEEVEGERRVRIRYAISLAALRPVHAKFKQMLAALNH